MIRSLGNLFKRKCKNWKVCLDCIYVDGLNVSLSQRTLNATQNSWKKLARVKNMFFIKHIRKNKKHVPQRCPNG